MINAGGEDSLSLRKLAVNCGVSNTAPYAHFKNKEEMISAMKEYISEKFTVYLLQAIGITTRNFWRVVNQKMGKNH